MEGGVQVRVRVQAPKSPEGDFENDKASIIFFELENSF